MHRRGRFQLQRMPAAESRLAECWRNSHVPADTAKGIEQEVQACITLFARNNGAKCPSPSNVTGWGSPPSRRGTSGRPGSNCVRSRAKLVPQVAEEGSPARSREHKDLRLYRGARRLCTVGSIGSGLLRFVQKGWLAHIHRFRHARLHPGGRRDHLSRSSDLRESVDSVPPRDGDDPEEQTLLLDEVVGSFGPTNDTETVEYRGVAIMGKER